jgi:phage/plasmid-like protein (TIGR03299 family)
MAANLATSTDGRTAMMLYVGETPWHCLGQRLDNPATAEEAITAAGLDYEVLLTPLATVDGLDVPQRKAVIRYDNQSVLGVVGNSYVPIQNRQAFGFLDAIVGEGKLRYHTAGALGKGERIWMLAKLPDNIRVKNSDDTVDKFLLLSNAHDGSAALRVLFTPVRVVCQNTLSMALRQGAGQGVSVWHEGNLAAKLQQAQEVLGFAHRFYDDAAARIDRMASHYPSQEQLKYFFEALYPNPEEERNNTRAKNVREELHQLFETGIGHDDPAIKGTTWTALNAVTEYIDHHRSSRGKDDTTKVSQRLNSIWFGSGANIKAKAWDLAVQMAASN